MSETIEHVPEQHEEAPQGDSLRDVLSRSFDEIEARDAEPVARDDRGRFAKAEEAPAETTPEQPAEPEAPAVERPEAWAADHWDSLSPAQRAYAAQREQAIRQELEARAAAAQEAERYKAIAAPHADRFRSMGLTEAQAFERLLAWEQAVRTNPQAALAQIAQAYGVDPRSLIPDPNAPSAPMPQVLHDPRLDALLAQQAADKQAREAQEAARIDAEIAAFRARPDVPHFDKVRPAMAALMQYQPNLTLQEAYDRAVWADPTIREAQQAAALKAAEEARRKAEAAKVAAAKSRAVSVRDSAGTSPGQTSVTPKSLRSALEEAFDQAT